MTAVRATDRRISNAAVIRRKRIVTYLMTASEIRIVRAWIIEVVIDTTAIGIDRGIGIGIATGIATGVTVTVTVPATAPVTAPVTAPATAPATVLAIVRPIVTEQGTTVEIPGGVAGREAAVEGAIGMRTATATGTATRTGREIAIATTAAAAGSGAYLLDATAIGIETGTATGDGAEVVSRRTDSNCRRRVALLAMYYHPAGVGARRHGVFVFLAPGQVELWGEQWTWLGLGRSFVGIDTDTLPISRGYV